MQRATLDRVFLDRVQKHWYLSTTSDTQVHQCIASRVAAQLVEGPRVQLDRLGLVVVAVDDRRQFSIASQLRDLLANDLATLGGKLRTGAHADRYLFKGGGIVTRDVRCTIEDPMSQDRRRA